MGDKYWIRPWPVHYQQLCGLWSVLLGIHICCKVCWGSQHLLLVHQLGTRVSSGSGQSLSYGHTHLQVPVLWQGPVANTCVVVSARVGSKGQPRTCALAAVGILAVVHYCVGSILPWTHSSVEVNGGDWARGYSGA